MESKFDFWAIVELFGHSKIAGYCTSFNGMLKVDVPETKKKPSFTRFIGIAAIYAINPVDEQTCKLFAERMSASPVTPYDSLTALKMNIPELVKDIDNIPEKNRAALYNMISELQANKAYKSVIAFQVEEDMRALLCGETAEFSKGFLTEK